MEQGQENTITKLLVKKNGINNYLTMKVIRFLFLLFFIPQITFSQTFGGIGAKLDIDSKSKFPFIVELTKGLPAEKAGLLPFDIITKLNGHSTYNYTFEQTLTEVRGEVGTLCSLTILRKNKEYSFELTRVAISKEKDNLSFSSKLIHATCELPEERIVNVESEEYKLSQNYLQEAKDKKERAKHFMKLAIESCKDNKNAHLAYADLLKSYKDGSMRSTTTYNPSNYTFTSSAKQQIYQPKNWQHFTSAHEDAYGYVLEHYDSVLAIDPKHLRSRLNVADIYYFNGEFDSCMNHLNKFFCAIPMDKHNLEVCSQGRRMIRRCIWLKSLPENSIKLNTLYWDKGRAENLLFALGTIGMTAGEIYSYRSGKLDGALVGAGFNFATMAIQKSRDNLKWFGKLDKEGDYAGLYEKCIKQLPMRINTTGFYSYETMMMLAGIIHAGGKLKKPCSEFKNNAIALIDIIQIANPPLKAEFDDFKFIVREGLEAGIDLAKCDRSLFIYEELELYEFLLEFNKRLMEVGDESYLPEKLLMETINRRDLLKNLVDSVSNPSFSKHARELKEKRKLEKEINAALVSLHQNPDDIEVRTNLAFLYEEQNNYKSAITHYEYILNYYKKRKDTKKSQDIGMRLKACNILLKK